jgi:DNA invertase Pin-like site-specific DNA recombinase
MAKDLEDSKTDDSNIAHHAYLRVSTDAQDVDNQRHGILEYSNSHGFANLQFTEDSVSGKTHWRERKLGELIDSLSAGDVLIFAEISRIARSTLQVLEVLEHCMVRSIAVHIAKQKMALDGSMQSRITSTVLGLAAEIEREFISIRTREALAKRKAEGVTLGRPKGPAAHLHLDAHDGAIRDYLAKGIGKRDIARLLPCAPSTLYDWLDRRGIRAKGAQISSRG